METLLGWAEGQGCKFPHVNVKGRELYAKTDVPSDTALIDIPQHLLLHEGHAWTDQDYGKAFEQLKAEVGDALDKRWTLCLLLLVERARGEQSRWAKYINVLPKSYEDPMWWSEEDLDILKGTRLRAAVEHYAKGLDVLRGWRERLCTIQSELGRMNVLEGEAGEWAMSETALRWAKSTVWSRAFNIKALGPAQKESIALIPVLDMLDHNPHQHVAWHTGSAGKDNFCFLTKAAIKQGDLLFSNYGHKSNEELLLGYGFVLEQNSADFFSVSLGLEASSAAGRERAALLRALLQRLGLQTEFYLTRAFPLPSTLVVAAAACLLPSAQAYSLLAALPPPSSDSAAGSNGDEHCPDKRPQQTESSGAQDQRNFVWGTIEVRPAPAAAAAAPAQGPAVRSGLELSCPVAVHLQALLALKQQLRGKMARLQGGTFQDDMQLASAAPVGSPTYMALVYRAGQKEIAHAALHELAQQTRALLDIAFSAGGSTLATPGSAPETLSQQDGHVVREHLAGTPWHWGLEVLQKCEPGQELLRVPLSAALVGGSRADLVLQLALMRLGRECAALCCPAPENGQPDKGCAQNIDACSNAREASFSSDSALLARLIRYVDVPFAATLLTNNSDSLRAAEALAGTQLGDLLQGESEQYREQYAAAAPPLTAALAAGSRGEDVNDSGVAVDHAAGASGNELCPGVSHAEAMAALSWADAVVDRCGMPGPSGSDAAVLPLICALPKELHSLAVDFRWEDTAGGAALVLSAAVHLKAGLVLTHAPLLRDSSFESLLLNWGPRCCTDLQNGAASSNVAFELCIDPPDKHPHAILCRDLLVMSGLGGTHWLTLTTGQEPLLAAIAVCCADEDSLHAMGALDLLRQHAATENNVTDIAPKQTGLAEDGGFHGEDLRKQLVASEKFVTAVKGDKHLMKAARRQLKALLQDARSGLNFSQCIEGQGMLDAIQKYRSSMKEILDYNLSLLQQHLKRPAKDSTATKKQAKSRHR